MELCRHARNKETGWYALLTWLLLIAFELWIVNDIETCSSEESVPCGCDMSN
jgi:hypothetical protein